MTLRFIKEKPAQKKATIYEATGNVLHISPNNGTDFTLEELQGIVGGFFEIQGLPGGKEIMVLNEKGRLLGLPVNEIASGIWKKCFPLSEFPYANDGIVVGNIMICGIEMIK